MNQENKDFEEAMNKIKEHAEQLAILPARDELTHSDRALIFDCVRDMKALLKLNEVYQKNIDRAMKYVLAAIKNKNKNDFKWTLVEAVVDKKVTDAIELLAKEVLKKESRRAAEQ